MSASTKQNRRRTANPHLPRFVYPNGKRYRALVRHGSEIFYVGTFGTPEEASKFAERLAKRLRGKSYTPVAKRKTASKRSAVFGGPSRRRGQAQSGTQVAKVMPRT